MTPTPPAEVDVAEKKLSEQVFGYTPAAPLEDETYVRVFAVHRLANGSIRLQIRNGQLWNTIELPAEQVAAFALTISTAAEDVAAMRKENDWRPISEYDKTAETHEHVLIAGGSFRIPASMADEWRSMGDRSAMALWSELEGWTSGCDYDADAFREYQPVLWRPMPKGRTTCQCRACLDNPIHASSCAVHNEPTEPNGSCDCGHLADSALGAAP